MSIIKQCNTKYLTNSQIAKIHNILVIQLGPFGDVLLTTSYFESLKNKMPNCRLSYLTKEPFHKVLLNHPFIDEIITINKKTGWQYAIERIKTFFKIRSLHFDLIIDQQNKPSSQQITFFSGAKYRIGFRNGRFHQAYNFKSNNKDNRYNASTKFDILEPLCIKD